MKKIAWLILCLSFALAVNLFCIGNAIAETDTGSVTIVTNNNGNQKTTIEVLGYDDVEKLSEELITSKDKIYTEQN